MGVMWSLKLTSRFYLCRKQNKNENRSENMINDNERKVKRTIYASIGLIGILLAAGILFSGH
jgi:hypothetical protein